METNLWSAYVCAVVPREEHQQVTAKRVGQSQSTISRWKRGEKVPDEPANVVSFARAYDRNVLEAFVAAGLLDAADAGRGLPAKSRQFLAELAEEEAARDAMRSAMADREASVNRSRQLGYKKPRE